MVGRLTCTRTGGGAVNLMLYGGAAFWVCVDSHHLSAEEVAAVVEWEHGQPRVTSAAEAAERVVQVQRLVAKEGAVYCVVQRPGMLVTVPAGVLHAVYTTTTSDDGAPEGRASLHSTTRRPETSPGTGALGPSS
jgi:hypothetical protein